MKLVLSIVTGALLAGVMSPAVFAQDGSKSVIKNREERQEKRIQKGVENGQLNEKEARRLEAQEKALKAEVRRDKADGGRLTGKEKAKITRQQDKLNRRIAKQAHDKQTQK
jgi:hypothetical protein